MPVDCPNSVAGALQALATTLIDRRRPNTPLDPLARDLLHGMSEACTRLGLDRVLEELGDLDDREAALVAQLGTIGIDSGSPRNQQAKQLADCVVKALELNLVEEPDRRIVLPGVVRAEVATAMAQVLDVEMPKLRDSIVEDARPRVDEAQHGSFNKMVAQLDDRGQKLAKLPKIPIDAQHAIERALAESREAVIGRIVGVALDRAKVVLERANAEAAARLDAPISLRATPRQVAMIRAADARVPKTAAAVLASLFESLAELARIGFAAVEKPVHPYAATKTFAVGDAIEHPKFGRGSVVSVTGQRMDVDFGGTKATLVHAR